MTIEEAIKTAIEYETRVREAYVEALEDATNSIAQRIFRLLADEENRHVTYLESKLSEWVVRQRLTLDDLETALPSPEAIEREVSKLEKQLNVEPDQKELEILQKVKSVELETSNFYKRMVSELPQEGQELFSRFVAIEEGHLGLVEAEIGAVSGSGYWFDMAEFNIENG